MRSAILAFVFGVWVLQQAPHLPSLAWFAILPPLAGLAFVTHRQTHFLALHSNRVISLLLCAGLGYFWAAGLAHYRLADALLSNWESRDIQLIGVVSSLPQMHARGERFLFDVEQVVASEASVPRRVSITRYFAGFREATPAQVKSQFHAGERWRLTVRMKRPHGSYNPHGLDFEAWALERNIRATGYIRNSPENIRLAALVYAPGYLVERLRERVRERFQAVLGGMRNGAVLQALAIGDDDAITDEDWQTFRRTGVVHLMSISGLHVTMLAGLAFALVFAFWRRFEFLLLRLPARKAAALAGLVVAVCYALVAGFAVPTQRTLYMLAVVAAALWYGRTVSMSLVLCWALLVVVLVDPWSVLAPGFWLSFGAVALLAYAGGNRLVRPGWLREAAHAQWVIALGLTPLLLALFQQVSVISPLANAFAIPVISLLVTPLTLLGAIVPLDGILLLAHMVMSWCMQVLQFCADFPLAVWQQHALPAWSIVLALAGVLWMLLPRGFPLRWMGVGALAPLFMLSPDRPQQGEMRVSVLDVGQGLAVVVQTARHTLLYDTGPRYSETADSGTQVILPYLRGVGVGQLDGLVITHDDLDHTGGAASMMRELPVAWQLSSMPGNHALSGMLKPHHTCSAGQSWTWDGIRFDMLHPSKSSYAVAKLKDNNRSCVLKVTSEYGSLLLTGDIERASEMDLLQRDADALRADMLVVPHHGSKTSSLPQFVAQVAPRAAVFAVGYRNRFGHPKPDVVERYRDSGSTLYRSDQHGAVLADFAAVEGLRVRAWRQLAPRYWHEGAGGVAETGRAS